MNVLLQRYRCAVPVPHLAYFFMPKELMDEEGRNPAGAD